MRLTSAIAREVAERARVVDEAADLRALRDRLRLLLRPLLDGAIYLPDAKALLSRDGGVCPHDGARLDFDPLSPDRHTCPRCGAVCTGARHHRAWVTRYHLWLSERAVHCALLGVLCGDAALTERAAEILAAYAGRYRTYPNRDNVLGPTRLFFSTYLESIWLVQTVIAAAFVEAGARSSHPGLDGVRAMVEESADLIATFDEGGSNRQVWNDAALIAAGAWLGRDDLVHLGADAMTGVGPLLAQGVGRDGLWHEGENYHLFALRGFLLAGELLRWVGRDLYAAGPLGAMYAAPLATLLPDLTLPARGDGPYGVSVLQPRFAELWEIGRARVRDPRLDAVLAALYAASAPAGGDVGWTELAEQEWNRPPSRQRRDQLGWKALLWMPPNPPAATATSWTPGSTVLEGRGLVVLREGMDTYVSVECGRRGQGGHGHPDLLHLTCFRERPIFADFGTGSYVRPSLHWYRSTLSHNAPGIAGIGQQSGEGECRALDGAKGWGWSRVVAHGMLGASGEAARTVIVGPRCVIDVVDVDVPKDREVDLALHPLGGAAGSRQAPRDAANILVAREGHESGYDAVGDVHPVADRRFSLDAGKRGELLLAPRAGETVFRATAPGPPAPDFADGEPLDFLIRRAIGPGRWVTAIVDGAGDHRLDVAGDRIHLTFADGEAVALEVGDASCTIRRTDAPAVALAGTRPTRMSALPSAERPPREPRRLGVPLVKRRPTLDGWPWSPHVLLGEASYRRSEEPYDEERGPTADLAVALYDDAVIFRVMVRKDELIVRGPDAPDPALDNEAADIHSDGAQCYVGRDGGWDGYVVLPDLESDRVRVRAVAGTAGAAECVTGTWRRYEQGYEMLIACRTGRAFQRGDPFQFQFVVNEMRRGRERRAGQLALGGGGWVYLRGDRESPSGAVAAEAV